MFLFFKISLQIKQNYSIIEQCCSPYCILLYGPSGSGKSYIAKYLSNISHKPSINIQVFYKFVTFAYNLHIYI